MEKINLEVGREYHCISPVWEVSFRAIYAGVNDSDEHVFRYEDGRGLTTDSEGIEVRGARVNGLRFSGSEDLRILSKFSKSTQELLKGIN